MHDFLDDDSDEDDTDDILKTEEAETL